MTEKRFTITGDRSISDHHKKRLYDLSDFDGVISVTECLNELHEENNELRLQLNLCSDQRNEFHRGARENANRVGKLEKENEQLKQRNTNQYNQLNHLWKLIQAKDWETLTDMDNQMKEDEELLKREWECYE